MNARAGVAEPDAAARRLVSVGNVIIDITAAVPALPERGGDVLATASGMVPGGGFTVMLAATRQGLATDYAGAHGTGPFGDLARAAMAAEGIHAIHAPLTNLDTGWDVVITDDGGERTFVTAFGAEARLTNEVLERVRPCDGDLVCVSGYGLLAATNGAVIAQWVAGLAAGVTVLVDPGPLVGYIPPAVWSAVIGRTDWLSCNEREARLLTGQTDARQAALALARTVRGVLVRRGAAGCLLVDGRSDGRPHDIPGFAVEVVDTNGAGDTHTGAFLAALAHGLDPADAALRANAAAALAVRARGPAAAPTRADVDAFLARRTPGRGNGPRG